MRKLGLAFLIAFVLVLVTACDKSPTAPAPITESFALTTIDQHVLPVVIENTATRYTKEVMSQRFTIKGNTFADTLTLRRTLRLDGLDVTIEKVVTTGTFERHGDTLVFSPASGPKFTRVRDGVRFFETVNGRTYQFNQYLTPWDN